MILINTVVNMATHIGTINNVRSGQTSNAEHYNTN